MTDEIKKLTNVEYTLTEEVINRKWAAVASKRRQLLSLSDWTQIPDSGLSPTVRHYWKVWRQKIRNIKRTTVANPDDATELLKTLEKQSPDTLNYDDVPAVEQKDDGLTVDKINQLMDDKINNIIPQLLTVNDVANILNEKMEEFKNSIASDKFNLSDDLVIAKIQATEKINKKYYDLFPPVYPATELLNEAIEFKVSPNSKHPLLEVWANSDGRSLDEVADFAIANKTNWLKLLCDSDARRLNWLNRVSSAASVSEIIQILKDCTT